MAKTPIRGIGTTKESSSSGGSRVVSGMQQLFGVKPRTGTWLGRGLLRECSGQGN